MASDSMTASFGGEQLGRFNTPKFEEGSTHVTNKPISSAYQAFEVFQRLQRDNQARANRKVAIPLTKKNWMPTAKAGAPISRPWSWPPLSIE